MLACLVLLVALVNSGATSPGVEVDDLTGKQFEAALETEDNLAVYWCKYFTALIFHHHTITPEYGLLQMQSSIIPNSGSFLISPLSVTK